MTSPSEPDPAVDVMLEALNGMLRNAVKAQTPRRLILATVVTFAASVAKTFGVSREGFVALAGQAFPESDA